MANVETARKFCVPPHDSDRQQHNEADDEG